MLPHKSASPGSHVSMTTKSTENKDNKHAHARNKNEDMYGNPYDCRSGYWGEYDRAIDDAETISLKWLTIDRCLIELELLNYPGKPGRRYEYPPSLIQYMLMKKESDGKSYRTLPADCRAFLRTLGLKAPCYKTVQNSAGKFFRNGFGIDIMTEAGRIMREECIQETLDPVMFIGSGSCPEYSAPQKIPTCQKDLDDQAVKDADAADMRNMMEVFVSKQYTDGKRIVEGALDGSGVGISGYGIYIEYVWCLNERNFIKQHVLLDMQYQNIVSFSVTMEQPGDSKLLIPIVEGTMKMGVKLVKLTADSAYDSKDNWNATDEYDIEFVPNLRSDFKKDKKLAIRHTQRLAEEKIGKKIHHRTSGYSMRWLVEAFFSAIKRMYGDRLRVRLFDRMAIAMRVRYMLYTIHRVCILRRIDPRGNWTFV